MVEEGGSPRLENASDADDEPVEDDDLERKRSRLDDVPLRKKREFEKGSIPRSRDQPVGAERPPFLVVALVADGGGKLILGITIDSRTCGTSAGMPRGRTEDTWCGAT